MAIDGNYQYVTLLIEAEGTDGAVVFADSSQHHRYVGVQGNAQIDTVQKYIGVSSCELDGAGDHLYVEASTDLNFGAGDFTWECWVRRHAVSDASYGDALWCPVSGPTGVGISISPSGKVGISASTGTSWDIRRGSDPGDPVGAATVALDTWTHIAVSRSGSNWYGFVDGVLDQTFISAATLGISSGGYRIGRWHDAHSRYFNGHIDNLRVTKGVCRYTSGFNPLALGYEPSYTTVVIQVSTVISHGGGNSAIAAPSPILYMGRTLLLDASATAPSPTLSAFGGGNASITAPSPRLNFTAHGSYGDNAAFVKPPKITVSAYGGGRAALTAPSPNLTSTATGTALAAASLTAPNPTVEALGTVSNVANISITIPGPNVLAYAGSVCSVTIAGVTVQATGTGGGVAHAAITIPLFQLDAQGTAQNHGGANISAPMPVISTGGVARITIPMATLTAIGTATVVATYEAYALNLKHMPRRDGTEPIDEVTHYTNFPFTHIVRYKGRYYGANTTGLYLLEGTTDDGAAIDWAATTHLTDLGYPEKKTVVSAYFGGRLGAAETVTLTVGEKGDKTYAYTTPRGAAAQNYRQKFGRGIKTRYFGLGLSGTQDFALDTVDLEVDKLTRRI